MPKVIKIKTTKSNEDSIKKFMPIFEANKTYKDPVKIQEDLKRKESEYLESVHLEATTGKVQEIAILNTANGEVSHYEVSALLNEKGLLNKLLSYVKDDVLITFNGNRFDIPFLMKRFWVNGLKPTFNSSIDVMRIYTNDVFGIKEELNTVSKFLLDKEANDNVVDNVKLIFDIYKIVA